MAIIYVVSALLGGLVSCALLWPYGAAIALLSMPFGGSLIALLAVVLVYMRASHESRLSADHAAYPSQPQKVQTTGSRQ